MRYPFCNLVFEGGGVKGLAYVGALEVLEQKGILPNIIKVGGASAGAITAVLLALGLKANEVRDILASINFEDFKDGSGFIFEGIRLVQNYGLYKGDRFKEWIGEIIQERTGLANPTFRQLEKRRQDTANMRELFILGTNLATKFSEIFSFETTPEMGIVEAVRISMSIPLFFAAVKGPRPHLYVDGGVLNNYPVQLFDQPKYWVGENPPNASLGEFKNSQTLGFRLDSKEEIDVFRDGKAPAPQSIGSIKDYLMALIGTLMAAQDNRHLEEADWNRTVYINTLGIGTTDFNLSPERKKKLIESGRAGAVNYFDWWEKNN